MPVSSLGVVDIDPVFAILVFALVCVGGYTALLVWRFVTRKSALQEKRGLIKELVNFSRLPTVPTIRISMRGNTPILELGKRAKLRAGSLLDKIDTKGWDILSSPVMIRQGREFEPGFIVHPAGCTLDLKTVVKAIKADDAGKPVFEMVPSVDENGVAVLDKDKNPVMVIKPVYIEANFEGVIGVCSDLDDFNESTQREVSKSWILPFIVGCIAGVIFLAPIFAWLMSMASNAGH